MALNNATTVSSDGATGNKSLDLDINSEKFYVGYKIVENLCDSFSSLSDAVSSVASEVSSLGINFTAIVSKMKDDTTALNSLCSRMGTFKTTLENIDSSNTLLFAEMDLTLFENFGEDMSETDQALYIEKCTTIYNLAIKKDPDDLTDVEKSIIENLGPYMKLNEYAKLDNKYNEANTRYQEIDSFLSTYSSSYDSLSVEDKKMYDSLVQEKKELEPKLFEFETNRNSLRGELLDMGLLEMTAGESLDAAGKKLWNSFTDIFKTGGDLGASLVEADEFVNELVSTGAVAYSNVLSGVVKVLEYVADGVMMAGGAVASVGTGLYDGINSLYCKATGSEYSSATSAMWDGIMNEVAVDTTGKLYNGFYGTKLGQNINDNSALKYDSAGATAFKDVSIKATEIVAATAVTIVTGGTAAPFVAAGIGFLEGTGKTGEERFSAGNREAKDVALAFLGGVGKAAEWYGYGQVGGNVYNGVKNILSGGTAKEITKDTIKEAVKIADKSNSELVKGAIKNTFKTADVYIDSAAAVANAVTTRITTDEWNVKEGLFDLGLAIGGNMLGDVLGGFAERSSARKTLESLDSTKIKELLFKNLSPQGRNDVLELLGSLPSDKMNGILKDMDYPTTRILFTDEMWTASVIKKLDVTDVNLVKKIVGNNINYGEIFSNEQIYKIFTSSDSEVSDLGKAFLSKMGKSDFISLFNDYDFSQYGAKLFSSEDICENLFAKMGADYIKNTFGTDGLYNLLDNMPFCNSRAYLISNLSDADLSGYFNHLRDIGDIKTIANISSNSYLFQESKYKYKYLQAIFGIDDCDEIVKQLDFQNLLSGSTSIDLFKNLSSSDVDKLNQLLIPDNMKIFERADGSRYFLKYAPDYKKVVNGKNLHAYWFSDDTITDRLVYSHLKPDVLHRDISSGLLNFLNEEYFNSNRIISSANFNDRGGYLGYIIRNTDGTFGYEYSSEFVSELTKNRDNYLNFFKNGLFQYGNYGVNQAALKKIGGTNLLSEVANEMAKRYNTDPNALMFYLSRADTVDGICSYADLCDKIFLHYSGREADFLNDFGYSMYRIDVSGKKVLNSEELLSDLYIFNNSDLNGGKLFVYDYNKGGFSVSSLAKAGTSQSFGSGDAQSCKLINNFFKYHNIPLKIESIVCSYVDITDYSKEVLNYGISSNTFPSLVVFYKDKNFPIIFEQLKNDSVIDDVTDFGKWVTSGDYRSTKIWSKFDSSGKFVEGIGHIIPIIGFDDNYVYVASWGKAFRIKLADLNRTNSFITVQNIIDLIK